MIMSPPYRPDNVDQYVSSKEQTGELPQIAPVPSRGALQRFARELTNQCLPPTRGEHTGQPEAHERHGDPEAAVGRVGDLRQDEDNPRPTSQTRAERPHPPPPSRAGGLKLRLTSWGMATHTPSIPHRRAPRPRTASARLGPRSPLPAASIEPAAPTWPAATADHSRDRRRLDGIALSGAGGDAQPCFGLRYATAGSRAAGSQPTPHGEGLGGGRPRSDDGGRRHVCRGQECPRSRAGRRPCRPMYEPCSELSARPRLVRVALSIGLALIQLLRDPFVGSDLERRRGERIVSLHVLDR